MVEGLDLVYNSGDRASWIDVAERVSKREKLHLSKEWTCQWRHSTMRRVNE
jgi:hypothetical protein